MKHTRLTKRVLACGLALAMVTTSTDVEMNVVKAKKKKSSKKSTSKATTKTVTEGKTIVLKVKKAKKKVKWSCKNKKVAQITKLSGKKKQNATVKGLSKGTAKIIAKIGKKKQVFNVKVKASAIKSVSFDQLDSSALIVRFSKKTTVNAADVKLEVKDYQDGTYNVQPKVEAISTSDQKTYRMYLTSGICNGDYVKITHGKAVKEVQRKDALKLSDEERDIEIICEKDETQCIDLSQYLDNAVGHLSFAKKKGSKLPAGMSLAGKKRLLKGIPTAAGDTTFTLVATDEAGRSKDVTITYKVYDDTTIASKTKEIVENPVNDFVTELSPIVAANVSTTAGVVGDTDCYVARVEIAPKGGSGMYKYSIASQDATVHLSTDQLNTATNQVEQQPSESTIVYLPYGLAEGEHSYPVTITDAADPTRTTTTTVNFTVKNHFNVSGAVTDAMGTALSGNEDIYFIPAKATDFSKHISKVSYEKYDDDNNLVGGNRIEGEGTTVRGNYLQFTKDGKKVWYQIYTLDSSAKVGPLPQPTVLVDNPTVAQVSAAPSTETAAPTATPGFKLPTKDAGKYAAELPAGDYVVKVRANNGVLYHLDQTVSITTDTVDGVNLTMPVRFANLSMNAKFANGKGVAGQKICFTTSNKQFEDCTFTATTDYTGKLNVSLPVGTYQAYWVDENGQKQYFTNPIKVEDATNVEYGDITLAVSRTCVTGVAFQGTGQSRSAMMNETLYFFDKDGKCYSTVTNGEKALINGEVKSVTPGGYSILLPEGTYTVRCEGVITQVQTNTATPNTQSGNDASNASLNDTLNEDWNNDYRSTYQSRKTAWFTIGSINVAGADFTPNPELTYTGDMNTDLFSKTTNIGLTLGTESTLPSTGNNDIVAKFDVPEPAANTAASRYQFDMSYTLKNGSVPSQLTVIGSDGKTYTASRQSDGREEKAGGYQKVTYVTDDALAKGTYYVILTPINAYIDKDGDGDIHGGQSTGIITAKVSAYQPLSFTQPQNLVSGAAISVTTTQNNADPRLQGKAYFTMDVQEGSYYNIAYSTPTLGGENITLSYSYDGLNWKEKEAGLGSVYVEATRTGKLYFCLSSDVMSATYTISVK